MNNTATSEEEIRNALDAIARTFQPSQRPRFTPLIPYKNQIRELRSQKASFQTIAKLLKKFSVQTTGETVRRFYRIVIEQKTVKRKRRQQRAMKFKAAASTKSRDIGEPRIARIEDL